MSARQPALEWVPCIVETLSNREKLWPGSSAPFWHLTDPKER